MGGRSSNGNLEPSSCIVRLRITYVLAVSLMIFRVEKNVVALVFLYHLFIFGGNARISLVY